jgi:hypothetical protein
MRGMDTRTKACLGEIGKCIEFEAVEQGQALEKRIGCNENRC